MSQSAESKWEQFHLDRARANHPRWPVEALVKIVFGGYLARRISLPADAKVIDVGCGFGNNLLPFLDRGMRGYGVEITEAIAETGKRMLAERGFHADIRKGGNREIPFEKDQFDLLLSMNVLHYEPDEARINEALEEYKRVLKPGAAAIIFTVGPEHTIYKLAESLDNHRYRIANYDFRNGEHYFYFDNLKYLDYYVSRAFGDVELARVTEQYPVANLDFLIAVCRKTIQ